MLAPLATLVAAAPVLNATSTPQAKWIVMSSNRDHASCKGSTGEYTIFLDAKPGMCTTWMGPPSSSGGPSATVSYKFSISASGISVITFSDANCRSHPNPSPPYAFGGCITSLGITIDLASYLPSPQPGQYLEKRCWGREDCSCTSPVHVLAPTRCVKASPITYNQDAEVDCGEGVQGYSTFQFKVYKTRDGSCSGEVGRTEPVDNVQCTTLGGDGPIPKFGAQSIWCGAGCAKWKTFRAQHPVCDGPRSHSAHAIDLNVTYGPNCRNPAAGAGSCCYAPLGYDGGSPYSTPCLGVCLYYGRYGSNQEYCGASGSQRYGNCFCGPKLFAPHTADAEMVEA